MKEMNSFVRLRAMLVCIGVALASMATVTFLWFGGAIETIWSAESATRVEALPEFADDLPDDEVSRLMKLIANDDSKKVSELEANHLIAHLRRQYPLVSIRHRLSRFMPKAERRESGSLNGESAQNLDEYENGYGRAARRHGEYVRPESFELLHNAHIRTFIESDGNGHMRTPPPSAVYLKLELGALPLDAGQVESSISNRLVEMPKSTPQLSEILSTLSDSKYGYDKALEAFKFWAQKNGKELMPDVATLKYVHRSSHDQFLHSGSHGYVKSIDEVSGYLPHHFRYRPRIEPWDQRYDDPNGWRQPDKNAMWLLKRLELVSLLLNPEPMVYLSDALPRMDQLSEKAVRELNEFETTALERLYKGENIVLEARENEIKMFGAIRGSKTCMNCHDIERGELLGAFSYSIRRSLKRADELIP